MKMDNKTQLVHVFCERLHFKIIPLMDIKPLTH